MTEACDSASTNYALRVAETPTHMLRYQRFALRHWREKRSTVSIAQWHAIESRIVALTLEIDRRERRVENSA